MGRASSVAGDKYELTKTPIITGCDANSLHILWGATDGNPREPIALMIDKYLKRVHFQTTDQTNTL